jgi:hypothetical protein
MNPFVLPALPTLIDAVIVVTLIECLALGAIRHWRGRGPAWRDVGLNIVSGLCLMLALRCLAHGEGASWVSTCLLAAGVAHGADLWRRWPRAPAHDSTAGVVA